MQFPNIFDASVAAGLIDRIQLLQPDSQPLWGVMNVGQMLAHSNVTYEMVYENKHPKPNFIMRQILKAFVKKTVVGPAPYKRNSPTAPAFLIKDDRDFQTEKNRLINHINQTAALGEKYFDQKESLSFGKLSKSEWNIMFYKHLDHHLSQFGV